jgi:hypothetical protein
MAVLILQLDLKNISLDFMTKSDSVLNCPSVCASRTNPVVFPATKAKTPGKPPSCDIGSARPHARQMA